MYRIKIVAAIAALSLFMPPPQAIARPNTTAIVIGAAVLGAALASSSSHNDRSRDRGQYYTYGQPQYYSSYTTSQPQYYSYNQPQYYSYSQPQYYRPGQPYGYNQGQSNLRAMQAAGYYSDGYQYYKASDLYRHNTGIGRDRLGVYTYDTGIMTPSRHRRVLAY